MEKRKLGRINYRTTVINLGGCGPGIVSQEEADDAIELAYKKHGINMIDVAPSYGEAEIRLKPWITQYRKEFFIAEKTTKRTKKEAWDELKLSLERTGAEHFDLYQFHAVGTTQDLDIIFGNNGAMEAFLEAKETGLIRHIGITGHADMRVFLDALNRYDFDTILMPVTVASMTDPQPENDFRPVLEEAITRNIGVQAIKSVMKRRWPGEEKEYNTWYEPLDQQQLIDQAVWFTLSQKGVSTCPLPCDIRLWPMVLDAAERYKNLSLEQIEETISFAKSIGQSPLFPHS